MRRVRLWDFEQLGVGSDLLDWGSDGDHLASEGKDRNCKVNKGP